MRPLAPMLLLACSIDTEDATLIDEVTVLAIVPSPPEIAPGQTLTLDVWVVDPQRRGVDLLVWFCLPASATRCREGTVNSFGVTPWAWVGHGVDGLQQLRFDVPESVSLLLPDEETVVPVQVWALACVTGACAIHEQVESPPRWTTLAWGEMIADLSDPARLLEGLSMDEANLAVRHLLVSQRPLEERNLPPQLLPIDEGPITVEAGGEVVLSFQSVDALLAWPYTTAGAFEYSRYSTSAGAISMRWLAPRTPGPVRLFVVAEDGLGGSAMWSADALVTP